MSARSSASGVAGGRRESRVSALTLWSLGYVVIGIALATAAAWPVYASPRALAVGILGGMLGIAVAMLSRMLHWSVLTAALAAVAVYLVAAVPLAIPAALSSVPAFLAGLRDAVLGVVLGWKQMLTLNPPLGEYQAVLVPFLVVMLFGSFLATLLALQHGRRAAVAVPVVAGMSVFGIAFGLTGTSGSATVLGVVLPAPREWAIGVAVFVSALTWLVGRSRLQRARALRKVAAANISRRGAPTAVAVRRHLLSAGLLALALTAGLVVSPVTAGWADRTVLRDGIEPMVLVQQQPSPLASYRAWFADDRIDQTVLEVRGDTGRVQRIRLVTLDSYDGADFHVAPDARFSRLPRLAGPSADRASLGITIGQAYRGIWVPAPAGLAEAPRFAGPRADALADGFRIDEGGDTAITVAEAPGGAEGLVPGDRYSVLVDPATDAADDFSSLQGGESMLDVDRHPALTEWTRMQELPRTGAGFLEAVDRLRARGYLSHSLLADTTATGWIGALARSEGYAFAPSYAGHSVARVEQLFSELVDQQRRAGADAPAEMLVAAVGDDEQFAAAAELLAQHWGLTSRIVLGARLEGAEEVPGIPVCREQCTGGNMSAWVEVRTGNDQWMPVDVTPQFAMLPSTITEGERLPEHPTVPEQPRSEALDPPQAQSDSNNDAPTLEEQPSPVLSLVLPILKAVGVGALALTLLVLPLLVLVLAKGWRIRRRRAAGDPEIRLVGAWEELADMYADWGVVMDARGTRVQRAQSTGRDAAERLAVLVERAVFAPHPPSDAEAAAAWAIVDAEREELRRGLSWWRRLIIVVRPTSFAARAWPSRRSDRRRPPMLDTLAVTGVTGRKKGNS